MDALLGFIESESMAAAGEEQAAALDNSSEESDITSEFGQRMKAVYDRGRAEAGYNASYFLSMLAQHGPVETAHRLWASAAISDGFAELWERGRLDLTVEAIVVDPKFSELFTPEEIDVARKRLQQFGYDPARN